jgi:hypothetical protein
MAAETVGMATDLLFLLLGSETEKGWRKSSFSPHKADFRT